MVVDASNAFMDHLQLLIDEEKYDQEKAEQLLFRGQTVPTARVFHDCSLEKDEKMILGSIGTKDQHAYSERHYLSSGSRQQGRDATRAFMNMEVVNEDQMFEEMNDKAAQMESRRLLEGVFAGPGDARRRNSRLDVLRANRCAFNHKNKGQFVVRKLLSKYNYT